MSAALSVKNLSFAYPGGRQVLRDVSFTLREGEAAVLAGYSGAGKSTLLRILCGLLPGDGGGELSGEALLFGEPIGRASEAAVRAGLVFQDSDAQIVCTTVEDELAFAPENLCLEPSDIRRRVDAMAARLGFADKLLRDPATLSGGEKKLLCLGSVLMLEPRLVLLDEPMSGLDSRGRALVSEAIEALRREGRTVLASEHDLSLAPWADRVLYLNDGGISHAQP